MWVKKVGNSCGFFELEPLGSMNRKDRKWTKRCKISFKKKKEEEDGSSTPL